MHSPKIPHLDAINRILRYLKGTPRRGVSMKNNNSNDICGYSDVDWAGSFDRKSTTSFYTFVGGNLATWKSKKKYGGSIKRRSGILSHDINRKRVDLDQTTPSGHGHGNTKFNENILRKSNRKTYSIESGLA
jgi:hypothetical protein